VIEVGTMEALWLSGCRAFLRYSDLPGTGPALVWVPCLGGAAAGYMAVAGQSGLAGRRAVLVDLPGFGCSDRPEGYGYALEEQAGAVASLLDHLGLRGSVVIGHSMGGSVAITLAGLRPELVGRLIIAEAPLELGKESASRAIAAQTEEAFADGGFAAFLTPMREAARAGDATLAAFLGQFQVAAPRAVHRTAVAMMAATPGLRARFLGLGMPRVYIWGERTLAEEPQAARIAAELAREGMRVRVVPGAGHLMNLDNPAGFAGVIAREIAG
jgi:pimeloyl-ACP methyl ester carboxylesterase